MRGYPSITIWLALTFLMAFAPCQVLAASITETKAAIGEGCTASGSNSTAMGYETTASGDYSTAMGYETTASGDYSWAGGRHMQLGTIANHTFVWGYSDIAVKPISIANAFFIFPEGYQGSVGIGTSMPAHALEVDKGNILVQGAGSFDAPGEAASLFLGDINNSDLVTPKNFRSKNGWKYS